MIIDQFLPATSSKFESFKIRRTSETHKKSGYELKQSLYVQVFKFI